MPPADDRDPPRAHDFSAAARAKLADTAGMSARVGSAGRLDVIVMLELPPDARGADISTAAGLAMVKAAVQMVQDRVLSDVLPAVRAASNERATPQRIIRFSGIPGFAARLTADEIEAMAASPLVVSIAEDAPSHRQ